MLSTLPWRVLPSVLPNGVDMPSLTLAILPYAFTNHKQLQYKSGLSFQE